MICIRHTPLLTLLSFCLILSVNGNNEFSGEAVEDVDACPKGSFIGDYEECEMCSECGPGYFEEKPCTKSSDTKCVWCLSENTDKNENFAVKCGTDQKSHRFLEDMTDTGYQRRDSPQELGFGNSAEQYVLFLWCTLLALIVIMCLATVAVCFLRKQNRCVLHVFNAQPNEDRTIVSYSATLLKQQLGKQKYVRLEEV